MKVPIGQAEFDLENAHFDAEIPTPYYIKYLKGVFTNEERFISNVIEPLKQIAGMCDLNDCVIDDFLRIYRKTNAFTYKEAFELINSEFRSIVFGSINVAEMMENLGSELVKVEGKNISCRVYKEDGSYTMETNDVIYELYKINCKNLGLDEYAYAIKCWCTTTNKEHWLWVEEKYALKGPLEAIASTMRVYENMIPFIKSLKRQGDVLLFEMTQKVIPSGNIRPLTADEYFGFLISQS